jgi:hypothetical protein
MKEFSFQTRNQMSESARQRCTLEWRNRKSKMMETPLNTEAIRKMYEEGHTQAEIAQTLGVSQKVIWKHMKNHGIAARVAAKREQSGPHNHMWKGKSASYQAMHLRVQAKRGKASQYPCCICGTTNESESFDWANLTGRYDDINDYAPMCRKCHREYDRSREMMQHAG